MSVSPDDRIGDEPPPPPPLGESRWSRLFTGLFDPFDPARGPPPRATWPFTLWLMRGASPALWLFAAVSLALGAVEAAVAWAIGRVIDLAGETGPERFLQENGLALAGLVLFLLFARPVLMVLSSGISSLAIGPGLFTMSVARLHRHTMGQSVAYFQDDFAGRISQKELQTANAVSQAMNEFFNAIAYGLASVVGATVVLAAADWRLGLVITVWFAVYALFVARYLPLIRTRSRARADARSHLSGQMVDQISHIETIKLFAHRGREDAAAETAMAGYYAAAVAFGRTIWGFRNMIAFTSGTLPAVLVGLGLYLWQAGDASLGAVATAALIATRLAHMAGWISFVAMTIFTEAGVLEDGMRTLSPPHTLVDAEDAAAPAGRAEGRVRFDDVRFRYGRTQARRGGGLDGMNAEIAPGEKVALVGPSGAGKSTAIAALLRLHDVEGGRVTLDGHDVRALPQDWLRRQIATVTQEPALFNRSAFANIAYGDPEAPRAAVLEAAERARAHDFIADISDPRGRRGYDAHLGERGVKLSGGQRQRIAIARAILKDAPILVLDEATSALDSEVEAEIQAALEGLMADRTVLAIAHRLSTVQSMDRILVMDGGRIVEQGSHTALLGHDGLYARLWQRQSGGFLGAAAAE
ncbi:MAG: ABC transporter ATP-binding protein [Pseudomonadota bacterium]